MTEYQKKLRWSRIRIVLMGGALGAMFSLIITRFIFQQSETVHIIKAILFGFLIGVSVSTTIQLISLFTERHLKNLPLLLSLTIPPILYSVAIAGIYYFFFSTFMIDEDIDHVIYIPQTILFSLALTFAITLVQTISQLLGQKVLLRLIMGTYHKPRSEKRFVMFLDIVGSTTIAEKIGDGPFHSLLHDFFTDITEPVLQTQAEIYKYVGDEVILTWKEKQGSKNHNALQIFNLITDQIQRLSGKYLKRYGLEPRFRAGLHFGEVIVGEMGSYKKEIALLGDTMNTAARIQSACSEYKHDFLISNAVKEVWSSTEHFKLTDLGAINLKGKDQQTELYSVEKSATKPS